MKLYRLLDQENEVMAQAVTNDGPNDQKTVKALKAKAERAGWTLEVTKLDTMDDIIAELDEMDELLSEMNG